MKNKIILMGTDTVAGVAPQIMKAIIRASNAKMLPYGNDSYTKNLKKVIRKVFEKNDLEIIPMMSGTASNALAISSFLKSYEMILCHDEAHINRDEGGAPEFFSCGGKLINIINNSGKLTAHDIENKINKINFKNKEKSKISGVSITQLAENGTIYSTDEILQISKLCKKNNIYLHMDGARFANALAFQNKLSPAEASWKIGVDCLSLGATKNGALAAEVIIFFNSKLAAEAMHRIKKTGHVIPKTRFISAQLYAWFKNNLWLELAQKANQKAKYFSDKISKMNDFELMYPTHGNEIFLKVKKKIYEEILKLNIVPNLWSKVDNNEFEIRFVVSFDTKMAELNKILSRLKKLNSECKSVV